MNLTERFTCGSVVLQLICSAVLRFCSSAALAISATNLIKYFINKPLFFQCKLGSQHLFYQKNSRTTYYYFLFYL